MPKWGLTEEMVKAKPWGLDPELELLDPAKVITDPVHGDIYLNRLELLVVDAPPFQRLRRVRQLGMTAMVYPGATNTRFAHSLGAVRAAQDLLDVVLDQRHDPHGVIDLFSEWERTLEQREELDRRLGEAIVLARLGALLHDLCHVPFGHSIEDDLSILIAHDKNKARFGELWRRLVAALEQVLTPEQFAGLQTLVDGELYENLRPLILAREEDDEEKEIEPAAVLEYPFVADIVGNTICADLIDYLARDHLYAGLPLALGHRFLSAFFVTTRDRTRYGQRMALNIFRDERERTDVITELLKYLRYRYELTERVLVHHAKLAADAMVGKALELWFEYVGHEERRRAREEGAAPSVDVIEDATRTAIEERMLEHGDDGLLEFLARWSKETIDDHPAEDAAGRARLTALSELAVGLLHRDLFRLAGRCSTQQASAEKIYTEHGPVARRRDLEEDAATFAGIEDPWKIVIWLPPPSPRLKSAEVLVYDGSEVVPFADSEEYRDKRGEDIYDAHKKLWAVSVYIHPSIEDSARERALVRLAQRMEVRWDGMEQKLTRQVLEWPERLVSRDVCRQRRLAHREPELRRLAREEKVARGPADSITYEALYQTYDAFAEQLAQNGNGAGTGTQRA